MRSSQLQQIVEAVLYEGYILYPYRASSRKNRQRFTFGRVYPQAYSDAERGAEPCRMQTECLLRASSGGTPRVEITIGFLQPVERRIARPDGMEVGELRTGDEVHTGWVESIERQVKLEAGSQRHAFNFPASEWRESIQGADGQIEGFYLREQAALKGEVTVRVEPEDRNSFRIAVQVLNLSEGEGNVLMRTFASTHIILHGPDARFVSLTDPPTEFGTAAARCRQMGCWPVLIGDEGAADCDTVLASPIILPDYPQIAPESAGNLFDGLEIDEILSLRILTMTEEEKREMRGVDARARTILERTESLSGEQFERMHGTRRDLNCEDAIFGPARSPITSIQVQGATLLTGDPVIIRPRNRADTFDLLLRGRTAFIEAIEEDAEGKVHVAVVLEDDPGRDLGLLRQPGHRFFYAVDEIEPVNPVAP